jgi:hypothetical protein
MKVDAADYDVQLMRKAGLIAGLAILVMALTVPVVEFYIFPTLIDYKNAAQTTINIREHTSLFSGAIFIHFVTVVCDVVAAWALYIFLRPVDRSLALLTAWFRIVNTTFTIVSLLNLIQILSMVRAVENSLLMEAGQVHDNVLFYLRSFNLQWRLMLVFFGIYLNLLGLLVLKAKYIPRIMGVLLIVAGLGYIIDDLKYFFYPKVDTGMLWVTYFGELVFMFWLLFKGSRIKKLV